MEKKGVKKNNFVVLASIFFTAIVLFAFVSLSLKVYAAADNTPAPSKTTYSWFGKLEYSGSASECSVSVPLYYTAKPGRAKETLVAPVIAFDSEALSYSGFEFEQLNPPLVSHEDSYVRSEGKRFGVNNYFTLRITRKDKTLKDDAEHVIPSTKLGTLSFSVKDTSISSPIRLYFVSTSYNRNRKTSILVDNTAHKKKELEVNVLSNCGQSSAVTSPTPTPSPTPILTPTPSPTPTLTPSPTPEPSPTPSPTPISSPSPMPSPTASPTLTPTPSPVPTLSPTPTPSPSPTKTPRPTSVPVICTETDGGMDSFVKGILSITSRGVLNTFEDSCNADGKSLTENFCTGGGRGGARFVCKFGCEDGACKKK